MESIVPEKYNIRMENIYQSKIGKNSGTLVSNPCVSMENMSGEILSKYVKNLKDYNFTDTEIKTEKVEIGFGQNRGSDRVISCVANMNKHELNLLEEQFRSVKNKAQKFFLMLKAFKNKQKIDKSVVESKWDQM